MEVKEYLTISELAEKLKIKRSWLYARTRKAGEGSIPKIRVGRYLRFCEDDVLAWLKQQYSEDQR